LASSLSDRIPLSVGTLSTKDITERGLYPIPAHAAGDHVRQGTQEPGQGKDT